MQGEKYIVAAMENSVQISIRNMLNPAGYMYLSNCSDSVSLMRLIRSYGPDFIILDGNPRFKDIQRVIEAVDDEMLCSVILLGSLKDFFLEERIENYKVVSLCPRPVDKNILIHTVELTLLNFRRVVGLEKKLREMTENYETRKLVECAKWILMERESISEKEAYERMRKRSMNNRVPIKEIAEAIIFTHEMGGKK